MLELFIDHERGSLPFCVKGFFDLELKIRGSRVQKGKRTESSNINSHLTQNSLRLLLMHRTQGFRLA